MQQRTPVTLLVAAVCTLALLLPAAPIAASPIEGLSLPGQLEAPAGQGTAAAGGPIHWSFESRTLEGWQVTPGSDIEAPIACRGNLWFHPLPLNKDGTCFLSTMEATGWAKDTQDWYRGQFGDNNRGVTGQALSRSRGVIESPRFTLTRPTVSMLVAGGGNERLFVAACAVDAAAPGGCREIGRVLGDHGEWFAYKTMDLSAHLGSEVFLRVVDDDVRGWSHLAIDNVRANTPAMPRGFRAARGETGATVSWRPVAEPAVAGYHVWRRDSDGESPWPAQWTPEQRVFTRLTTTPVNATTFHDATAEPDRAYWYRVAAVETGGLVSEENLVYLRPEFDPALHARGAPTVYEGDRLSGVAYPVGPIGYGGVLHLGDGVRNLAWIFNIDAWTANGNWSRRGGRVPNSFFAVRAQREGGEPVVRALQTVAEGPFAAMSALRLRVREPVAEFEFDDEALPVQVRYEVESSTVPGDLRDSSIPTAISTMTVRNPGPEPATVSLLATQQNAIGYDGQGGISGRRHPGYGLNRNTLERDASGAHLHFTGCTEGAVVPVALRCNGGLALSMLDPGATGSASWGGLGQLHADFAADGEVAGPDQAASPEREVTVDGALSTTFTLAPGESRSVPVVLSWYIPTSNRREHGGFGVYYRNVWDSARDVHAEVLARLSELKSRNRLLRDTIADSNLPQYVIERLTSQLATMRTPTVFWSESDFLGGYEGHGCCPGMPAHVWQYAQLAPRLWPEIDRKWQSQWLDQQAPDGAVPYRHALPLPAVDGQAGVILGAYRAYRSTGDAAWLARYWLRVKRAMDYLVTTHDPDEDGILHGSQPMTLDQRLSGTSSWLGSMYLAALQASARMAEAAGSELDAARYRRIFQVGRSSQDALLWNGEYYAEAPDGHPVEGPDVSSTSTGTSSYGNGLIADMLLGQWWAGMLGLEDVYDGARMTAALRRLYEENFRENLLDDSPFGQGHVYRVYARPTDAGLRMMTWPHGDRPADPPRYHDEVWSGQEYATAATMIQRGLVDEGLRIVRAAHDRHDGRLRTNVFLWNCGAVDGGGNPFGDDECGKWYARAMSNWSVLLALQGFQHDAATATIGFAPRWRPAHHRSFFSAGAAWGTFEQRRTGAAQTDSITLRWGELRLRRIELDAGAEAVTGVTVEVDGVPVAGATFDGDTVVLPETVALRSGQALTITLERH